MTEPANEIIVLGGANGSGKTTAAKELLPQTLPIREFINADDIALGLSPHNVEGAAVAAARAMIGRMNSLLASKISFAFETTCAGRGHVAFLNRAKSEGWRISLLFLWLPSPQDALDRVQRRVRDGGHNIPADIVIRRYWKGISALRESYLPMADVAAVYDNSDNGRRLIAERQPGQRLRVHDEESWRQIESVTR